MYGGFGGKVNTLVRQAKRVTVSGMIGKVDMFKRLKP